MAENLKESGVEEDMVNYLAKSGDAQFAEYQQQDSAVYDTQLCLIPTDVIAFIKDTQPDTYQSLEKEYGANVNQKIVERVAREVRDKKTLTVLRKGIRDRGQMIYLAYFQPTHSKTPEHQQWYKQNRLTVIRQLSYSTKTKESIDVVLFVNGLPVVTVELKNALTGQSVFHAIKQYKDRETKGEPLFDFERCLVHFAAGTEEVYMATQLQGKNTFFLPFNKGLVNYNDKGFATAYLWEDVLRKDSLMNLIQNYCNPQINKEKYYDKQTKQLKEKKKKILIFPRFHQRKAVENLLSATRKDGVGSKYLVMHSAGSGKSNTITWLAHRLSSFYQNPDDDKAMFSSVFVVTDRRVLDRQIQDNIRQYEQVPGTVAYIDKNKTSKDLKEAIESNKRVIVTTLQKFPVISQYIEQNKSKTYAVIIDEAHSSQSGESARHLRKALSLEEAEEKDEREKSVDEIIEEEIQRKGNQENISFYAFTATPKDKTLEIFGTPDANVKKEPFDKYTMHQAIEEGFILDVLTNYMSWKCYYKLVKNAEVDDKEYEKKKTVRLLSSFVDLQDHAIERKTRVMLEHFVSHTAKEIQGKARAMLVTRSRLHAVRYKRKFDEIMREMKLPYEAIVAFSGTVRDDETGEDYTMSSMNNFKGRMTVPEALKFPQYRILIVANMYQTGFDEPMMHTMFVDKKLGDVNAVQTLSRLNRTMRGKDSTMVLDFVNDPEDIKAAFQKYYGSVFMDFDSQTDPNAIYDLLHTIEGHHLVTKNELNAFAEFFFKKGNHKEKVHPILDGVVQKYNKLEEEEKDEFRKAVKSFVRLYRFLVHIISFTDVELEKWYVFLAALAKKLPKKLQSLPVEVLNEVDLDSYKLQHQYTTKLELEAEDHSMEGKSSSGTSANVEDELEFLTKIIKTLNDTFGLDLTEADKVEFQKLKESVQNNEELLTYFNPQNSKDNIKDKFDDVIDDELLTFINTKLEFYNKLSEDKVNTMFKRIWFNQLYDQKVRGM